MRAFIVFAIRRGDKDVDTVQFELTPDQVDCLELVYKRSDTDTKIEGPGILFDYEDCDKELKWKPQQQLTSTHSKS